MSEQAVVRTPGITVFTTEAGVDFLTVDLKGKEHRDSYRWEGLGDLSAEINAKIAGRVAKVRFQPNDTLLITTAKRTLTLGRADKKGQKIRYWASFDQQEQSAPLSIAEKLAQAS